MLDLGDGPDKATLQLSLKTEKDAVLSDCDGSDMDYGQAICQPGCWMHMLNLCKQIMTGTTLSVMMTYPPPIVDNEEPRASTWPRGQPEEPREKLQVVKNKDWVFKRSKMPATDVIPNHIVYSPNVQKFGTKPLSHGRRSLLAVTVEDQARYDTASYWPINMMHRFQRCRHCDKRTTYACEKCKVPLYIECFKIYHGQ